MFRFILIFCIVALCACGGGGTVMSATEPGVASESTLIETAADKPKMTRTIETPWGPGEIYDPIQDPDFVEAFKSFRGVHHENEDEFLKTYNEVFGSKIYANYAALGCGKIQDQSCSYHSGITGQEPMHALVSACQKNDYKDEYEFVTAMEKFTWSRCVVWDPYKDKPIETLTVETPWGDKEIADPSKSLVVRKSMEIKLKSRKAYAAGKSWGDHTLEERSRNLAASNSAILAWSKFSADLINLGCINLTDSQCRPHIFEKLGYCDAPMCTDGYTAMPARAIAILQCKINGEDHEPAKVHDNVDDALAHMTKYECSKWRDEEPGSAQ